MYPIPKVLNAREGADLPELNGICPMIIQCGAAKIVGQGNKGKKDTMKPTHTSAGRNTNKHYTLAAPERYPLAALPSHGVCGARRTRR